MTFPKEDPLAEGGWLAPFVDAWSLSRQSVGLYDEQDRLRYANATYREIFLGGQEGEFTLSGLLRHGFEHGIGTVIECGDVDRFIADLYTRRRKVGAHQAFETDLMDGRWFFMNQTVLPNGWILTVGTDVTELKRNEKLLRLSRDRAVQDSETDALTGLPNRRRMFALLDAALAELATQRLCLALVDIDRFKGINDRFGHPAGDAVLRQFADISRQALGEEAWFGRIGGEEFMLLLPGLKVPAAEEALRRLQAALVPLSLGNGRSSIHYTLSAGLTAANPADSAETIVQRADQALYMAKTAGRNRITVLTKEAERAGRIA